MTQDKDRIRFLWASVVVAAILLFVNLLLPLGFDNNIYQAMGWTLFKYHGLPYLASWDHNFPGIALIHALAIALFGNSDLGFRVFDTLVHIAMAGLYFWLLTRWLKPLTAFVAIILWTIYYTAGEWGLAGQRDGYAVCFLIIGALLIRSERANARQLVATGIMHGLAIMMRPTYALFSIALAVVLMLDRDRPATFKRCAWLTFGAFLPWILYIIPYLFVKDGVLEFYRSIIAFNTQIYAHIDIPRAFFTNGRGALYCLAIIGILPHKFFPNSERSTVERLDKRWMIGFTIAAILSPVVMGKYFSYHFEPLIAIAVACSSVGMMRIVSLFSHRIIRQAALAAAIFVFGYFYYPRHLVRYFFHNIHARDPFEATYEMVLSDHRTGLREQLAVRDYVYVRVPANTPIEYSSYFTSLRWRIERPMATRFTTPISITASNADGSHPEFQQAWRREFVRKIAEKHPAYVILSTEHLWWPFVNDYADSTLHRIPGFDSVMQANYQLDTTIGAYALYRYKL